MEEQLLSGEAGIDGREGFVIVLFFPVFKLAMKKTTEEINRVLSFPVSVDAHLIGNGLEVKISVHQQLLNPFSLDAQL